MHKLYFIDVNYFVINSNKNIDNPWGLYEVASNFMHVFRDQRITQDVDRFCNQLSQSMPDLVIAPLVVAYYTYQTAKK